MDPIRMVQLSIHLTAVVVMAAYSAALISFLAIKTFAMPFTTMEGLLADGSYRFAVVGDSADYSLFQVRNYRVEYRISDVNVPLRLLKRNRIPATASSQ